MPTPVPRHAMRLDLFETDTHAWVTITRHDCDIDEFVDVVTVLLDNVEHVPHEVIDNDDSVTIRGRLADLRLLDPSQSKEVN